MKQVVLPWVLGVSMAFCGAFCGELPARAQSIDVSRCFPPQMLTIDWRTFDTVEASARLASRLLDGTERVVDESAAAALDKERLFEPIFYALTLKGGIEVQGGQRIDGYGGAAKVGVVRVHGAVITDGFGAEGYAITPGVDLEVFRVPVGDSFDLVGYSRVTSRLNYLDGGVSGSVAPETGLGIDKGILGRKMRFTVFAGPDVAVTPGLSKVSGALSAGAATEF